MLNHKLGAASFLGVAALAWISGDARAAESPADSKNAAGYDASVPEPTLVGVSYGPHWRNTVDLWLVESREPTPLVFVIHGGGWKGGSNKQKHHRIVDTRALLEAGISVASINYRLMRHSQEVVPPVKAPLGDAARALQFVRSRADEWNLDKTRVAAAGSSAGGCSSLWLAYHDDLADPTSEDPIAHESTRLACVALSRPQTTLDPQQMKQWIPNSKYGAHAFGLSSFEEYLDSRERLLPWIAEYSPYELLSKDDPPAYLWFSTRPGRGKPEKDPTHSASFGVHLKHRCDELAVGCEVYYPRVSDARHETITQYLIAFFGADKNRP